MKQKDVPNNNTYYKQEVLKAMPYSNYPNNTSNGLAYGQPAYITSYGNGVVAAVLQTISSDLFDTLGGDVLTITGTGFSSPVVQMSTDQSNWVTQTLGANNSTSISFTTSAFAAGTVYLRVLQGGAPSNVFSMEAWNPTVDPAVTLLMDAKSNPYNATTGVWTPRYSFIGGLTMTNAPGSSNPIPSDGAGGLLFNGNGALGEIGLNNSTGFFSSFLGTAVNSQQPGSYAAVFSSQTPLVYPIANYVSTPYNAPSMMANAPQGTTGVECFVANEDGLHRIASHVYDGVNGGYHAITVPVPAGAALRSVITRWSADSSNLFDLSVDGALSGAGYVAFAGATAGTSNAYTSTTFNAGTRYPGANPTNQLVKGVMKVYALLNAPASNTFITKFNKWKLARFGA